MKFSNIFTLLLNWPRLRCEVSAVRRNWIDLSEREKVNTEIQEILDMHTDPWGIKVTVVEVKQIDLPQEMQRADG